MGDYKGILKHFKLTPRVRKSVKKQSKAEKHAKIRAIQKELNES